MVTSDTPVPDRPGTTFAINNASPAPAIESNDVVFMEISGVSVSISDGTTQTGGGAYNPWYGEASAGLAALTCFDSSVYGGAYLYTAPASGLTSDGNGHATNATFIAGVGSLIPGFTDGSVFNWASATSCA